jgi:hypothetical protein
MEVKDEYLVQRAVERLLDDLDDDAPFQSLTPEERAASLAWVLAGLVSNGGFEASGLRGLALHPRPAPRPHLPPGQPLLALQWPEAGIFAAIAVLLAGFCFSWIRRRLT